MMNPRKLRYFLIVSIVVAALIAVVALPVAAHGGPGSFTRFFVPKPNRGAILQIAHLLASHNKADAKLIGEMIATPQAVWFTGGTPHEVQQDVKRTVKLAAALRSVPILVAYNIPFRDCAQFSAGGATTKAEYEAWIDGFAAGIDNAQVVVILEPDGLGIIPWYKQFRGTPAEAANYEWCQPAEADPATAAADRFAMLSYAVNALKAKPNVSVYLDATHSAWLNVSDAAHRLIQAGVADADGFFLNVSNYQFTANQVAYGTWISSCIALWPNASSYVDCPNQYWNGGPATGWNGTAMDRYQEWRNEPYSGNPTDLTWNTVGIDSRYAMMLGTIVPTTHFVVDTSRNGVGPWNPAGLGYPDPQDWCNPPGRGVGPRPTMDAGNALVDAYLWVKIPGESDGECTRGLGPSGTTVDPEWGIIDPAAGQWFSEMALDLVHNANPPLQ